MTTSLSDRPSQITLWGSKTSRVLRVHWALIELDLNYAIKPLRPRTADMDDATFAAIAPQKKVPVLQDGNLTVCESSAIITYLAERYSSEQRRLIPTDIANRAAYFQWISYATMELDATSLYVLRRHEDLHEIYGEAPDASRIAREYFNRMSNALAQTVKEDEYLVDNTFTGADIVLTSCLDWALRYQVPIPDKLHGYLQLTRSRPAYIKALSANGN